MINAESLDSIRMFSSRRLMICDRRAVELETEKQSSEKDAMTSEHHAPGRKKNSTVRSKLKFTNRADR